MKRIILAALIAITVISCDKEVTDEKLISEDIKTQTQAPKDTIKANAEFIGNWVNGYLCGNQTSLAIIEGGNDSTIYLFGSIIAIVRNGKFTAQTTNVYHTGEIRNGELYYCQSVGQTSCCSHFQKQ